MAGTHGNRTIRALLENANFEALRSLDILDLAGMSNADSESFSVLTTLSPEAKEAIINALSDSTWRSYVTAVPRQPFLPDASIDFAALTPSLTVDSALHRYDNL